MLKYSTVFKKLLTACPRKIDFQFVRSARFHCAKRGGEHLPCEQLATAVRLPSGGMDLSYGELKLMPFWDPLRGDPRFEKIVASLAPQEN